MAEILIIDDDKMLCEILTETIRRQGHRVTSEQSLKSGLRQAANGSFDVVFLDVILPDGNGIESLPKIRAAASAPEVIIITGNTDADGAELAIKSGAWDYIEKTSSLKEIGLSLDRAMQYRKEKTGNKQPVALDRCGIVGSSLPVKGCLDQVAKAAASETGVLIIGETGTGKELFARAIHKNSARRNGNFVVVDCSTLPENLVESILLGHKKGAFSGAGEDSEGLFKQADGGTIFLDEIGELPPGIQKAFLRVLQEQKFRPVGAKNEVKSNFRVVAATNRDLGEMVARKQFREDLLFRINSLTITLPTLQERKSDILELVNARMNDLCRRYGISPKGFSADFFDTLIAYNWPGNVRELFNAIDAALASAIHEPTIFPTHLPLNLRVHAMRSIIDKDDKQSGGSAITVNPAQNRPTLREFRENMDKQYLQELIATSRGDMKEVCRVSGLSRSHLYALLQKYGLNAQEH